MCCFALKIMSFSLPPHLFAVYTADEACPTRAECGKAVNNCSTYLANVASGILIGRRYESKLRTTFT